MMKLNKIFQISIIIIFILLLFISNLKFDKTISTQENDVWNHGHCSLDGGRLNYIGSGSKEHYKCEICGKEYTFDRVMTYK